MIESIFKKMRNKINKVYENKQLDIFGSKNGKIIVRDGFIRFLVNIKTLRCQCMKKDEKLPCEHLIFVFVKYYNLSDYTITLLYLDGVTDMIKQKKNNEDIEKHISNQLKSIECGICLQQLNEFKHDKDLFQCERCLNLVHFKCMYKWTIYRSSTNGKNGCIYCTTKSINSLGF